MKRTMLLVVAVSSALLLAAASPRPASAASQCLVVNEVYAGGGSASSQYDRDFVELLNRCTTPASLAGTYVKILDSSDRTLASVTLSGSLGAGHYSLVAFGGEGLGAPLPFPDFDFGLLELFRPGKVFLSSDPGSSYDCPTTFLDLVGYGDSNVPCYEGAGYAPAPTAVWSASRSGCSDIDNNSVDFTLGVPTPMNSSSAPVSVPCGLVSGVAVRSFSAQRPHRAAAPRHRAGSRR